MGNRSEPVVVFDIDDTLYPELSYVESGIRQGIQALKVAIEPEALAAAYLARFLNGERDHLIQNAAKDVGCAFDAGMVDIFLSAYRGQVPDIALSKTIASGLDRLVQRRVPLAAISDGDAVRQQRKVDALGLSRWLDPIVLTGALGPGMDKRSPLPFEMIEGHFGSGRRYAYVGDNAAKDFIHPLRRGWTAIQIVRPERVHRSPPHDGVISVSDEMELLAAVDAFLEF